MNPNPFPSHTSHTPHPSDSLDIIHKFDTTTRLGFKGFIQLCFFVGALLLGVQPSVSATFQTEPVEQVDPATISRFLVDKTRAWADAWASRNVNRYINYYAPTFEPEQGNYDQWETTRRQRVAQASNLKVDIKDIQVIPSFERPDIAETRFIQHYRASHYRETSRKVLTWQLQKNGFWMIIREQNFSIDQSMELLANQTKRS